MKKSIKDASTPELIAADRGYVPSMQLIEHNDSLVLRYIPAADRLVEP